MIKNVAGSGRPAAPQDRQPLASEGTASDAAGMSPLAVPAAKATNAQLAHRLSWHAGGDKTRLVRKLFGNSLSKAVRRGRRDGPAAAEDRGRGVQHRLQPSVSAERILAEFPQMAANPRLRPDDHDPNAPPPVSEERLDAFLLPNVRRPSDGTVANGRHLFHRYGNAMVMDGHQHRYEMIRDVLAGDEMNDVTARSGLRDLATIEGGGAHIFILFCEPQFNNVFGRSHLLDPERLPDSLDFNGQPIPVDNGDGFKPSFTRHKRGEGREIGVAILNSNRALLSLSGARLSPLLIGVHEMRHVAQNITDIEERGEYSNNVEESVIKKSDNVLLALKGQVLRDSHIASHYNTDDFSGVEPRDPRVKAILAEKIPLLIALTRELDALRMRPDATEEGTGDLQRLELNRREVFSGIRDAVDEAESEAFA